jgi:hypothetical protein
MFIIKISDTIPKTYHTVPFILITRLSDSVTAIFIIFFFLTSLTCCRPTTINYDTFINTINDGKKTEANEWEENGFLIFIHTLQLREHIHQIVFSLLSLFHRIASPENGVVVGRAHNPNGVQGIS